MAKDAMAKAGMSKDHKTFLEMPGHLIRRLHQISFALFVDQAKAFDITPVQYAALAAINNHPGIDQTTLSNVIAFDRTTIGDVVGRLEKKKLIKRLNGAVDRRTKSLSHHAGRRAADQADHAGGGIDPAAHSRAAQAARARGLFGDAQASRASQQRAQPRAVAVAGDARSTTANRHEIREVGGGEDGATRAGT